jgi:PTH1 family peptidyl-tRNA hydrolase
MKYLIVGLGNIGREYVDTRHNVGFMVIDRLMEKLGTTPEMNRLAYTSKGKYKGKQILMVMPTTYMNLSGKAVRYYLRENNIPIENLLVVTDDLALPFGTCRLKAKGSDGGHNGLKHIQEFLGTTNYARMRVGVGSEFPKGSQVDYVLSDFTDEEFDFLPNILDYCVEGILSFVSIGAERTMTSFNKKRKNPKEEE